MSDVGPVERAQSIADDVLFPNAETVDRADIVPASGLRALAGAGLFGCAGPAASGGLALGPTDMRRVVAAIGGSCGATFFVWVQHHGVVRAVASSGNDRLADTWLKRMCAGETIAGTAFAHLRRLGPPAIRATRRDGGWRLDGFAPWATSWGIAEVFSIYAVTDDGDVVVALIPGATERGDPAGVESVPLHLPVLASTGTVALRFDDCRIGDDDVIAIEGLESWRTRDRLRASIGQPATLGIAARAVALLGAAADDADAQGAHRALDGEIADAWREDERIVAEIARVDGSGDAARNGDRDADRDAVIAAASDHRAACLLLAQRATTALLAAAGGRALDLAHPGQRLGREAMFYTIQAQLRDGRAATLRRVR